MPQWYHFACFFKKAKITATHEIKNYDCLRYDDQQRIKVKLGLESDQIDTAVSSSISACATNDNQLDVNMLILFYNI